MLEAIAARNTSSDSTDLSQPIEISFDEIEERIRQLHGCVPSPSSIGWTIKELIRLGFIKPVADAGFRRRAVYQVLTVRGMLAMLAKAGVTHYRFHRSHIDLIAPSGK